MEELALRLLPAPVYGIWTLVILALITLIKAWPVLAKQAADARAQIRAEKRGDLQNCQQRLDAMSKRLDEAESTHQRELRALHEIVGNLKIEMSGILSAYRILETAEEARDRNSLHLKQARAILSAAFTVAPSTQPEEWQ